MLHLFKRTKSDQVESVLPDINLTEKPVTDKTNASWFDRLKTGLQRTRQQFTQSLANVVLGKKAIDAELLEEIETHLLLADVGVSATQSLLKDLTEKIARKELDNPERLLQRLKEDLEQILLPCAQPLTIDSAIKPYVILMVGINGAGKTTTIGKLAKHLKQQGKKVMLAAGDTFRAAAVEQLQTWGERNNIPVIAQQTGADSASVIYDAIAAAKARGVDVLLADTAGRLHTQSHLMAELQKVKRVMAKLDPQAPHEICLVLDAGIGQNTLQQAQQFHAALGLTGLILTKLDGTAKGGVIFALAKQMQLPIRFIGVGEGIDDLHSFTPKEFINALF